MVLEQVRKNGTVLKYAGRQQCVAGLPQGY